MSHAGIQSSTRAFFFPSGFSFGSLLVQVVERTLLAGVGRAAASRLGAIGTDLVAIGHSQMTVIIALPALIGHLSGLLKH